MPPSDAPFPPAPRPDGPPPAQYRPMRDPDGHDGSMRNLALAAAAIAVAVMGGVYVMSGHRHHEVPVIEPDATPLRVRPANPGGMQVAGADDSVLMNKNGTEDDLLAPPPEAPAPQQLAQQASRDAAPPSPALPPAVVPPAETAPPAAAEEQPLPIPRAAPVPVPAHPSAPATEAAKAPPARAVVRGTAQVQLAALGSEADARATWAQLNRRMPELLAGHTPSVERAEHDGKTFYRLRTGGFADIAAATAFCARLRARGGGCAIASF